MDVITVVHSASGATAKIHPFGATVTSFQTSEKRELLFISNIAKLDGSKAIRGGIPLVFPQFGRPDESMPQHGFLRTNLWEADESSLYDTSEAAGVTFTLSLKNAVNSRGGTWDIESSEYDCLVSLDVKVAPSSLTTTLTIQNTGKVEFDFQTLQHTYLKVENALDSATCNVTGLEGYTCEDKITNETYTLDKSPIIINGNVDRIYSNEVKKNLVVMVQTGVDTKVQLEASGKVDGVPVSVAGVVWNPFDKKAKEMSDFGNEQYKEMICVEPGLLNNVPPVKKEAILEQTLTAM